MSIYNKVSQIFANVLTFACISIYSLYVEGAIPCLACNKDSTTVICHFEISDLSNLREENIYLPHNGDGMVEFMAVGAYG